MKRFTALLLAVVLVLGLTAPVFGYNGENGNGYDNGNNNGYYNGENGYYNGENGYAFPAVWEMFERPFEGYPAEHMLGFIGEITQADCGNYTVEILNADGEVQLIVWLLTGLVGHAVINAATGFPANLEDHNGGEVLVIYGPFYTGHNVPQTNALVIAINLDEVEYNVLPFHHVIEAIERDENGEVIKLTVDNGGLIVTLNEDTDLQAWLTRQIVVLDEFQVGDEVLLWYGFIAPMYPAMATAVRALRLVPARVELDDEPGYSYEYNYTGEPGELEGNIVRAGINLYRVNINADALGYTVTWNAELRRAELTMGDKIVTLAPGFAVFYVNGVAYTMSAPSLLEGGRLFAPADFFARLK